MGQVRVTIGTDGVEPASFYVANELVRKVVKKLANHASGMTPAAMEMCEELRLHVTSGECWCEPRRVEARFKEVVKPGEEVAGVRAMNVDCGCGCQPPRRVDYR
jgi:hypothetical protein